MISSTGSDDDDEAAAASASLATGAANIAEGAVDEFRVAARDTVEAASMPRTMLAAAAAALGLEGAVDS
jgi:hypothetical protein